MGNGDGAHASARLGPPGVRVDGDFGSSLGAPSAAAAAALTTLAASEEATEEAEGEERTCRALALRSKERAFQLGCAPRACGDPDAPHPDLVRQQLEAMGGRERALFAFVDTPFEAQVCLRPPARGSARQYGRSVCARSLFSFSHGR